MKENIKFLLQKMNSETVCKSNAYYFETTVLTSLTNKKGDVRFRDGRMYFARFPEELQMKKETLFTIGKTQLVINNETGEIIKYYKPFFTSWKKVFNRMDKYLEFFRNNFDNKNLVDQYRLTTSGFTVEGTKELNRIKARLNYI